MNKGVCSRYFVSIEEYFLKGYMLESLVMKHYVYCEDKQTEHHSLGQIEELGRCVGVKVSYVIKKI